MQDQAAAAGTQAGRTYSAEQCTGGSGASPVQTSLIALSAALLSQLFGCDGNTAAGDSEPEPVAVVVPDLTGVEPELAQAQLRVLGVRDWSSDGAPEHEDLSPQNRGVGGYEELWAVVTTGPAPGDVAGR